MGKRPGDQRTVPDEGNQQGDSGQEEAQVSKVQEGRGSLATGPCSHAQAEKDKEGSQAKG